jgi:hypothetical protein
MSDVGHALKNLAEFAAVHHKVSEHHNYEYLQRELKKYSVGQNLGQVLAASGLLIPPRFSAEPVRLQDKDEWNLAADTRVVPGGRYLSFQRAHFGEPTGYEHDTLLLTGRQDGGLTLATLSRTVQDGRVVPGNYSSEPLAQQTRQEKLFRNIVLFNETGFNTQDGSELGEGQVVAGLLEISSRAIGKLVEVVE